MNDAVSNLSYGAAGVAGVATILSGLRTYGNYINSYYETTKLDVTGHTYPAEFMDYKKLEHIPHGMQDDAISKLAKSDLVWKKHIPFSSIFSNRLLHLSKEQLQKTKIFKNVKADKAGYFHLAEDIARVKICRNAFRNSALLTAGLAGVTVLLGWAGYKASQ